MEASQTEVRTDHPDPEDDAAAWLRRAYERIVTEPTSSLEGLLDTVGGRAEIADCEAHWHCHFVARDASGFPRVGPLAESLADRVVRYCIPRSRVAAAVQEADATGNPAKLVRLQREARELFTQLEKSGEGGELLLYLLIEAVLGIPQILCKMPLKTNPNVHVHGTDGVHAKLLEDGRLALYWGESKLYGNVASAIRDCLESLAPFLTEEPDLRARRDLLLIRDNLDAGDAELTAELVHFFETDNPQSRNLELRAACLVGFSLDEYPDPFEADGVSITDGVAESMTRWHDLIKDQIADNDLASFDIEVFCVPMPSVDDLVASIKRHIGAGE